ncbi:hypothetical protein F4Z99_12170 [Candidatus Poribacteria bacterium]|nr:hypothetical protein [Candidatus Poribacteria bacterium]MYB02475.1 hypothetical protein [Candidatus Poribacteria bacterium]
MLHLPPLRERLEDIAPLVEAFISESSAEYRKNVTGITQEALTHLEQTAWPGNIRQLKSTVQTAVALATTNERKAAASLGISLYAHFRNTHTGRNQNINDNYHVLDS